VPTSSAARNRLLFFLFLMRPFTVLMKQTRQAVHAVKQSVIFLRCLWVEQLDSSSQGQGREYWRGKHHCTIDLLFDLFGLACIANKNKNCQLAYSWFQTSQTGSQWYSDASPFSIPWSGVRVQWKKVQKFIGLQLVVFPPKTDHRILVYQIEVPH
jgi:hypothetical protein